MSGQSGESAAKNSADDSQPPDINRVERIFQQARRLERAERQRFIAELCAGDADLRREVESLLAQLPDADEDGFLSGSAIGSPVDASAWPALEAGTEDQAGSRVPPRIGRYAIIRKLGEGGMGVVYLAEQEGTSRRVALKVIHSFARSPMLLRRFEHEAQVLGRLRHPGIAQVYEAGVHDDERGRLPFIAMELVLGVSILEYAPRHKLSERERIELMIRVCDAVHHAHQHGVVHRDLKPANILVEDAAQNAPLDNESAARSETDRRQPAAHGPQPKIVDFGIARVIDDTVDATMHTRTGQLIGTLEYMSPEQAAGDPSAVDARADVYALGVVLYELIAGQPPLDLSTQSMYDALRVIREDDPPLLSAIDRRHRGDLTTILSKALEKDSQRRYQSAGELADELTRYLRDEPILAHPPSAMYQLRKFARRNRALVAATMAIVVVLIAATAVSTRQAFIATAARHQAEQEQHRAEREQQRAEIERERAEEHLADAHQLARTLLFEIDNQLVNVTGALPARRLLVERGLSYLDKLAAQAGDDPDLLEELAVGYVLIGDVQGDTQRPNIGDYDGALESYRTALSILDEDIDRMNPRARHTQYLAVTKMGDQLVTRNDHAGALEFYRRSLQIAIERDNLAEQGTSHARLADTLSSLGRKDSAREHRRESQRITNELAAANPEHLGYRRDLAVRHFETGIGLLSTDPAAALEQFTTFVSISEELAATDPDHAVYQRDIAVGSQRMGHALEALGRLDDALPLFVRELEIIERLAAADPDNFIARAEVAAPCAKIGEIYLARGDLEQSMHFFQRYLDISTACAEASPSNAPIQRDVGVAYYKMNQWHARQARDESLDLEARLTHWRAAKQWLQRCYDHFIMLRDTNLLRPVDATVPDVIAAEIAQCDETVAKLLRGSGTQ